MRTTPTNPVEALDFSSARSSCGLASAVVLSSRLAFSFRGQRTVMQQIVADVRCKRSFLTGPLSQLSLRYHESLYFLLLYITLVYLGVHSMQCCCVPERIRLTKQTSKTNALMFHESPGRDFPRDDQGLLGRHRTPTVDLQEKKCQSLDTSSAGNAHNPLQLLCQKHCTNIRGSPESSQVLPEPARYRLYCVWTVDPSCDGCSYRVAMSRFRHQLWRCGRQLSRYLSGRS